MGTRHARMEKEQGESQREKKKEDGGVVAGRVDYQ